VASAFRKVSVVVRAHPACSFWFRPISAPLLHPHPSSLPLLSPIPTGCWWSGAAPGERGKAGWDTGALMEGMDDTDQAIME